MRGWPIVLGVVIGFIGIVAVPLWHHLERSANDPLDAPPSPSSPPPSWPSPDQPATTDDPLRSAPRPPAFSAPLPPHFEPLFTALGLHQPARWAAAPDFTLQDLQGQPFRLRQLQGKLVLLNFWATWCAPCRIEMPSMERLYQTFKQTDFTLLAVALDRSGATMVKPFVEEMQLTFPILLDPTAEVARAYGVRGLPTTYLIAADGQLIGAAVGGRDWFRTEAKALIAGLLRQAAVKHEPSQARQ
jgi:peroxiredoxin